MSFGRPPTFSPFTATPPDRGSFPLDHEGKVVEGSLSSTRLTCRLGGECKSFMTSYLKCLSKNKNDSTPCRHLNKEYLECRMKRGLMERDSWTNLGLGNLPDSTPASKPVKDT
ncbi:unnamed protein product [Rhizoctonia solani]|uniref:Cytochrome c oxidase assembly protein COX19 n=1 Tax=Rhizoctonia solani TaxID=456999 RepID=A0A8H3GUW6_9AGAM|nr:unnamed protein product [Rhizoctonia solani]